MTLPTIVSNIAPLLPALMGATQFPRSDATLKFLNLGLGIVAAGIDVDQRLTELNETVKGWASLGQDPPQEWWDEFARRSDAAHVEIQEEASKRRTRKSQS